jgi:hypothetical protein
MAEAKTEIVIDVDYRGRLATRRAIRDIAAVDRAAKKSATTFASATSDSKTKDGITGDKYWARLQKQVTQFDKAISTMGKMGLKAMALGFKSSAASMILMAAGMLAVHAAFVLGNASMKVARSLMGPLAAGMVAVVAAAASAAAAIREQQAAMYAYKTTTKGEFGSGLNQTRQVMRALHSDTYLAVAGADNLNKAFAAVSKNSTFTMGSQNLLKGLMDFASAGQPLEQGVQKAGELIALLQDSKKSFWESKKAAEGLFGGGKEMKKAFKELKITTKKGLEEAIKSGKLASAAEVSGQFEAVSGTLINRLKGYFNLLKGQVADLGQPFLEPIKIAANEIFNILRKGFVKIGAATQSFGTGPMLETLVSLVDKLVTKGADFVNKNLKSTEGLFDRLGNWWGNFKDTWDSVLDKLRPLIQGARVIEKMFGEVWKHVKNIFSGKFGEFNKFLIGNEEEIKDFGNTIGQFLQDIFGLLGEFNKITQRLLPFINDLVKGLSSIVRSLTSVMKLLNGLGGGQAGALAMLFGMRGMNQKMAGHQGGFKQIMATAGQSPSKKNAPTSPTPPTVVTGPPTGRLGETHRDPPGPPPPPPIIGTPPPTPPTPPIGTTGGPGGPSPLLHRPEHELFRRAPKGGITLPSGKFYRGGSFLPTSQISDTTLDAHGIEKLRARPAKMGVRYDDGSAPAAAAAASTSRLDKAGRPIAPEGGATFGGKHYPSGKRMPAAAFASSGAGGAGGPLYPTPTGAPIPLYPTPTGGPIVPGGTPPTPPTTLAGPRRYLNKLQQPVNYGKTIFSNSRYFKNRDEMYLPGKGFDDSGNPNVGQTKQVVAMSDDEYRTAKMYDKTYGQSAYKGEKDPITGKRGAGVVPGPGQKGNLKLSAKYRQRSVNNRTKMDTERQRNIRGKMGGVSAKMGTSMLLGIGSQYMPEEAKGSMAMGAMAAQINPLLGLGVAGLGTAMNSKTKKGGALSGALGGAAMGATLGSVLPGVGTAVGAVVGTVVGAIGGMVMGHLNAQRAKAKAAKAVVDKQIGSIVDMSLSGTYRRERLRKHQATRYGGRDEGASEYRTAFKNMVPGITKAFEFATKGIYNAEGGFRTGDDLAQAAANAGMPLSTEDKKSIADDPESYQKKLKEKNGDLLKDLGPLQKNYNSRMDELKRITGMTDAEVNDLASSMGVNLMDSTVEFTDVVGNLGLAMVKTAEEMKMLNMNAFVDSLGVFDKALKQRAVPRVLNEAARTFRDKANSGGVNTDDKLEFLKLVGEQNAIMFGEKGGGTVAQAQYESSFGGLNAEGTDFKKDEKGNYIGGSAFNKGGAFAGMDPQTFLSDPIVRQAMLTQITDTRMKQGGNIATQLNAVGVDKEGTRGGSKFTVDAGAIQNLTKAMSPEQLAKFGTMAEDGFKMDDKFKQTQGADESSGDFMMRFIQSKIGPVIGKDGKDMFADPSLKAKAFTEDASLKTLAEQAKAMGDMNYKISAATQDLITKMGDFFKSPDNRPEWYTAESFKALIKAVNEGDTSTPRGSTIGDTTSSRLSTTMGRHSAMDASLTGKRTVTSSFRTTGLGSINSDHVTGRAYDLVGQNLGQYQTMAKAGGGFAEFHGVNDSRHLHVVPGPGAMGDRSMPVAPSNKKSNLVASNGGGGNSTYSFNIQGSDNASPQQIAEAVMVKLKQIERSNRERR